MVHLPQNGTICFDPQPHRHSRRSSAAEVVCDVLNALGAGFSLKFIDLFLKALGFLLISKSLGQQSMLAEYTEGRRFVSLEADS